MEGALDRERQKGTLQQRYVNMKIYADAQYRYPNKQTEVL